MAATLAAQRLRGIRALFRKQFFEYGPTSIWVRPQVFIPGPILDLDAGWECSATQLDFARYQIIGYIVHLVTNRHFLRQGHARRALRAFCELADSVGLPLALLAACDLFDNNALIAFYREFGFYAPNSSDPHELLREPNSN